MATLAGTKVVVIGGASGVGYAVAAAALAAGAAVVVGSSQEPRVEAAAERLGAGATGRAVDVRDETSVGAFSMPWARSTIWCSPLATGATCSGPRATST